MNFFKKPTVEFTCLAPGIDKFMPIIPAKDLEHQWLKDSSRKFAEYIKNNPADFGPHSNTARCPGIRHILKEGWIVRLYQDIVIETFGDGSLFKWESMIDQTQIIKDRGCFTGYGIVAFHGEQDLFVHRKNWPANTLKSIIKIVLPWTIKIPKGYDLIQIPVAYLDENRFTATTGMVDSNLGSHPCIIQLYWHVLNGKVLLKAGTPLAQFILKKKESIPWKITATESNPETVRDIIRNVRFVQNYNDYKKVFGDKE